jgi:hypothetical protein
MKIIIIQHTHNMLELSMRLSKLSAKIIHIPNCLKLLHCVMYFDATFAAFIQELISTIRWHFLTMSLHQWHRLLLLAIFRFCGQAVLMKKTIEWHTMAHGVQIIFFRFCCHLVLMSFIMSIKQDHLLW